MSDATKTIVSAYRLASIWAMFFTLVSLGASITMAMQNVKWNALDGQAKFLLIIAVFVSWGNTMMAFLSKASSRAEHGLPINGGGASPGTDFFAKSTGTGATQFFTKSQGLPPAPEPATLPQQSISTTETKGQ
jgi:hypothetical protein